MSIRINGLDRNSMADYQEIGVGKASSNQDSGWNSNGTAHGTYHMADHANIYEIQRSNNYEFVVQFDNDMLRAGETIDGGGKYINAYEAQEVLRMSVSSVFVPHFSQTPIEVRRGNTVLKYAGVPTFADGSLTLNDYIGADTMAKLLAWQQLSYNVKTEKVGLSSDYKKNATLIEYTPDLQPVRSWTLYGCWITSITEPEFNSDDNAKHTITVEISYDKALLDYND